MPIPTWDLQALVVSPDKQMGENLVQWLGNLDITAQICTDQIIAAERFSKAKFEVVVLDFDWIVDDVPFVRDVRQGRWNRNVLVVAIATHRAAKKRAAQHGTQFLLERPVTAFQVAKVFRSASGLMLRDRREYFRLEIELGVTIKKNTGEVVDCTTMNVSREGMAVRTPFPLPVGKTLDVIFKMPTPGPLLIARGTVIWDDKHGKAGLHLSFVNTEDRTRISEWLDAEFDLQISSR